MSVKKVLLATSIALLAIVIFLTWTIWNDGRWGWAYVIEVGATVLLLALIWPWLQNRQSTLPPP